VIVRYELPVGGRIFIRADGEHNHVRESALHCYQRWQFLDAGRAPCCPEVQHDHLASERVQADTAGRIADCEVWREVAHLRRMGTAIASRYRAQKEHENDG
jgi:hypothetical protein